MQPNSGEVGHLNIKPKIIVAVAIVASASVNTLVSVCIEVLCITDYT